MNIDIACACGKGYRVSSDLLGKKVKCKACGEKIPVEIGMAAPEPQPEPEPEPEPTKAKAKTKARAKAKGPAKRAKASKAPASRKQGEKRGIGDTRRLPQKKATSPMVLLGGIVGVAAVLLGGVYLFIHRDDPDAPKPAKEDAAGKTDGDEKKKDPFGWVAFRPADGSFEVMLPRAPKRRSQRLSTPAGNLEQLIAEVELKEGKVLYQVSWWDYPYEVPEHETFTGVIEEVLRGVGTPEKRERLSQNDKKHSQGMPGRELRVTTTVDGKKRSMVSYLYLVRKERLVQLTVVVQESSGSMNEINKFLDSLQVFEWD